MDSPAPLPSGHLERLRSLTRAYARLSRRGAGLGFAVQTSFALHLTLAYRGPHRPGAVLTGPVDPVGWQVDELLLVHSLDGYGAHEVLGRWPLEPRQLPLPFAA